MLKRIIGIFIPLLTCATLFAQDYIMFNTVVLELRNGEHLALQEGVKRHNDKYHDGENGLKAYLWYTHTGPNSGTYNWAIGPMKFSHMDSDLSKEHVRDWDKNVEKYAMILETFFLLKSAPTINSPL